MARLGRKLLFSLVPAGLLLVGGLVAAELWVRDQQMVFNPSALAPAPFDPSVPDRGDQCYAPHLTRGYSPIPERCGRNDLGLYVYGVEQGVPDDPRHLLFLGDSIADQQRWIMQATRKVREQQPDVVMFNGGIPGYDTCGELNVFLDVVDEIQPDAVFVQFCLNDYMVAANALRLPDGRVRMIAGDQVHEFPEWVLHSRLLLYVGLPRGWWAKGEASMVRREASQAEHCMERFVEETSARGIDFGVVLYPGFFTDPEDDSFHIGMDGENWTVGRAEARLASFMDEQGIAYIPLRPLLESRGPLEEQRNTPDDPWHPDNPTQEAIGDHIAPWMLEVMGAGD